MIGRIYRATKKRVNILRSFKEGKVFCIGRNKTGTTSIAKLFKELDIPVGSQRKAELLALDLEETKYKNFIKYIKWNGVAFQDIPFSLPNVYKVLDKNFPGSKFILTIRDSPEIWYNSLTSFHAKVFGNGRIPTKEDLQKVDYIYQGWAWEMNRLRYDTPEHDLYNKATLIKNYIDYNASVLEYFKEKPGQLLVVNLKEPDAAKKISSFLGSKKIVNEIPWENKT